MAHVPTFACLWVRTCAIHILTYTHPNPLMTRKASTSTSELAKARLNSLRDARALLATDMQSAGIPRNTSGDIIIAAGPLPVHACYTIHKVTLEGPVGELSFTTKLTSPLHQVAGWCLSGSSLPLLLHNVRAPNIDIPLQCDSQLAVSGASFSAAAATITVADTSPDGSALDIEGLVSHVSASISLESANLTRAVPSYHIVQHADAVLLIGVISEQLAIGAGVSVVCTLGSLIVEESANVVHHDQGAGVLCIVMRGCTHHVFAVKQQADAAGTPALLELALHGGLRITATSHMTPRLRSSSIKRGESHRHVEVVTAAGYRARVITCQDHGSCLVRPAATFVLAAGDMLFHANGRRCGMVGVVSVPCVGGMCVLVQPFYLGEMDAVHLANRSSSGGLVLGDIVGAVFELQLEQGAGTPRVSPGERVEYMDSIYTIAGVIHSSSHSTCYVLGDAPARYFSLPMTQSQAESACSGSNVVLSPYEGVSYGGDILSLSAAACAAAVHVVIACEVYIAVAGGNYDVIGFARLLQDAVNVAVSITDPAQSSAQQCSTQVAAHGNHVITVVGPASNGSTLCALAYVPQYCDTVCPLLDEDYVSVGVGASHIHTTNITVTPVPVEIHTTQIGTQHGGGRGGLCAISPCAISLLHESGDLFVGGGSHDVLHVMMRNAKNGRVYSTIDGFVVDITTTSKEDAGRRGVVCAPGGGAVLILDVLCLVD